MAMKLKAMTEGEGTAGGIVDIHWDLLQEDYMICQTTILNLQYLILDL